VPSEQIEANKRHLSAASAFKTDTARNRCRHDKVSSQPAAANVCLSDSHRQLSNDALPLATFNWKKPSSTRARNFVLKTDREKA